MKVSFLAKAGDFIYALPIVKALARLHGGKVRLVLSSLPFQLVPLLQHQPYIEDVELIYDTPCGAENEFYNIDWQILKPEEGINLTIGPRLNDFEPNTPWTNCYIKLAGLDYLHKQDFFCFPTLWNHRQWFYGHSVQTRDKDPYQPPNTIIFAPESETFQLTSPDYYIHLAEELKECRILVVGCNRDDIPWPKNVTDMRGLTTLPSIAYVMAEARAFIGALSAPFHLARHAGTPSFVFQLQYHPRSMPVDTPYRFYAPESWRELVSGVREIIANEVVTLWSKDELEQIWAVG